MSGWSKLGLQRSRRSRAGGRWLFSFGLLLLTASAAWAQTADLLLAVSEAPRPVGSGSNLIYTILVTNLGPSSVAGVTLTNMLGPRLTFVSVNPSQGSCTHTAGVVRCSLNTLAAGAHATVTLTTRASGSGAVSNQVSATGNANDPNLTNNFALVITPVVVFGSFANSDPIAWEEDDGGPGSIYPSTIFVSGLTAAVYQVTVSVLDLNHSFPDDIDLLLVGPGGQTVLLMSDCGGDNLLSGVNVTFDDFAINAVPDTDEIVSGRYRPANFGSSTSDNLPAPAPPKPWGNALSVFNRTNPNGIWSLYSFDDLPEDGGEITGGWSLRILTLDPMADLTVTQPAPVGPVVAFSNLVFTSAVTNRGPALAAAVRLTNALPPGVNFVSASPSSGFCTNESGIIICQIDTLAPNAGASLSLVVTPTTGGMLTNRVGADTASADLFSTNNLAATVTTVLGLVDLAVSKIITPALAAVGSNVTFSITVTNRGPNAARAVQLTNALPAAVQFLDASATQGTCAHSNGIMTCLLDTLPAGGTAGITLVCQTLFAGTATNTASVSTGDFEAVPADNTAVASFTIVHPVDLRVRMTAVANPVGTGQPMTFRVVVTNAGPGAASNVLLTNPIPSGANFVSAVPGQGGCQQTNARIECLLGALAVGAQAMVELTFVSPAAGLITNRASVTALEPDANGTNNNAEMVITVLPPAMVVTLPAVMLTSTSAVLRGQIVPNGTATATWFEWGTNASLGFTTATNQIGNGFSEVLVSAALGGLTSNGFYFARAVARNTQGTSVGEILSFSWPATPPGSLVSGGLSNGLFRFSFQGAPGQAYTVEASTNLLYWTPLGNAVETSAGHFEVVDPSAGTFPTRFYRANAP